jgi:hypothetical protein
MAEMALAGEAPDIVQKAAVTSSESSGKRYSEKYFIVVVFTSWWASIVERMSAVNCCDKPSAGND